MAPGTGDQEGEVMLFPDKHACCWHPLKTTTSLALALVFAGCVPLDGFAQPALVPDPSFTVFVNGPVTSLVRSGDKLVIGGAFSSVGGHLTTNVASLNADGSVDTSFVADPRTPEIYINDGGSGKFGIVIGDLCADHDGKVLVLGWTGKLMRLNQDGSRDVNFNSPALRGGNSKIKVQSDGKIILAGEYHQPDDNGPSLSIARLNPDGSRDAGFPDNGIASKIVGLAIQPDDRIVIAAVFFYDIEARPHGQLRRLNADGTIDSRFDPVSAATNALAAFALDGQGRILVGGPFQSWGAHSTPVGLVRLNPDGSVDTSFKTPSNSPGSPDRIWVRADGTIVLAGSFDQPITGFLKSRLMVLKPDGSRAYETAWGTELPDEFRNQGTILASEWDAAGNLLIGGEFDLTRLQPVANFSGPALNGQREFSALLGLIPNRTYRIEASTNLVNWTLLTNVTSASETIPFTDAEAAIFLQRFYRAIGQPQ